MNEQYIIAGTDTNIGKTVLSAMLMSVIDSMLYWKPIQSGMQEETDTHVVARLSECAPTRIISEAYQLTQPLSPHLSAKLDGVRIDDATLVVPDRAPLIIEMAGGLLVPINEQTLQIDIMKRWGLPVIVVARSSLGTINHTLLSLEAMKHRAIDVVCVVMIGEEQPENERAIREYGVLNENAPVVRIRKLPTLNKATLRAEFMLQFSETHLFRL